MSRLFTCPCCKKRVDLARISLAVVDLDGPPEWFCGECKGAAPREAWGNSNDGHSALSYFFYGGPGKKEPASQKLTRAMTRNATFAASFISRSKLRVPMPDDPGMGGAACYEPVAIYNRSERFSLVGRYFVPANGQADKVVLLLSGSGGTAHQQLAKVARRYCKRLGMAALLVDYRGFGSSDNKAPSEQGLFTDAQAMYDFLTEGVEMGGLGWKPSEVVIHGYSLGTGVATELAVRKRHAAGLVLQCPFTSAAAIAKKQGGSIGAWLSRHGTEFDVIGKLGGIAKPVLVLIANDDTDMKSEGDTIENRAFINVTVGRYDGGHFDPHNAFKDGSGKQPYMREAETGIYKPLAQPAPKAQVVVNKALPIGPFNSKDSTGVGCIAAISKWMSAL